MKISQPPATVAHVNTWEEFRRKWSSRQNFILGKQIFPFECKLPPLESVVDTIRKSPKARILKGKKADAVTIKEFYPEFLDIPAAQAAHSPVQLSHFELLEFTGAGGIFHGMEKIFEQWYVSLTEHGFTWTQSQRAFFLSGPNCHTNYHFDSSYVLAWQLVGRKRFCWLKDPERWCPRAVRRDADLYDRMVRPPGITADDVIELEMNPGDVLWNVMLTPHWVYSLDETSYSFNITHFELACDGKLSPIDLELQEIRRERDAGGATASSSPYSNK